MFELHNREIIMKQFDDFDVIDIKQIDLYDKPGVWALFGIEKEDSKETIVCLNVGKSVSIKKELAIDIERLSDFNLGKEKEYRNQFNECMFSYWEFATRLDWLYKEIARKYKNLIFIKVCDHNDYLIEKYFAYTFKARYWVSNGKYASNKIIVDSEIERIHNIVKYQIIENGNNKSLIEKIDKLKQILEKQ